MTDEEYETQKAADSLSRAVERLYKALGSPEGMRWSQSSISAKTGRTNWKVVVTFGDQKGPKP
jgi:hypothetical protein